MASGRKEAWEEGKATGTLLTGVDETRRRRRGRKTSNTRKWKYRAIFQIPLGERKGMRTILLLRDEEERDEVRVYYRFYNVSTTTPVGVAR